MARYHFTLRDHDGFVYAETDGDDIERGFRAVYLARHPERRRERPVVISHSTWNTVAPLGMYEVRYVEPRADDPSRGEVTCGFWVEVTAGRD
jgi:hypothetical protein